MGDADAVLARRSAITGATGAKHEMALFIGLADGPAVRFKGLQGYSVIR